MGRKSERNKGKSPDSIPKPEKPKRGRPSRKRRKSSSSEKGSGPEGGAQEQQEVPIQVVAVTHSNRRKSGDGLCDDDSEPVWQVKKSESSGDSGEIQKLKICLARPPSTPERPDRSPRAKKKTSHFSIESLNDGNEEKRIRHKTRRNSGRESTVENSSEAEDHVDEEIEQAEVIETHQTKCDDNQENITSTEEIVNPAESEVCQQPENNSPKQDLIPQVAEKEESIDKNEVETPKNETDAEESEKMELDSNAVTTDCFKETENDKDIPRSVDDEKEENVHTAEKSSTDKENADETVENQTTLPENDKEPTEEAAPVDDITPIKMVLNHKQEVVEEISVNNLNTSASGKIVTETKNEVAPEAGLMRKRRWGSKSYKVNKTTLSISTDSLKNLIPNVEPVSVEDVLLDVKPKEDSQVDYIVTEEKAKSNGKLNTIEKSIEKDILGSLSHRKISVLNDNTPKEQRSPSPSKYKSSAVLYITNLVRPFTLPQLKNLLLRTGKIVENGFWIDKIKSKCFVQYQNEDEAIETRHALHGVTWPVSNPKTLVVDFSSESAMRNAMETDDGDKAVHQSDFRASNEQNLKENDVRKERDTYEKRIVIREWDVGKGENKELRDDGVNRSAEYGYNRDQPDGVRNDKRKRSKSPSPARKFKKKEDEAPSKLLDDLFRKTKATPCIYWLPLNAETILIKEEQRRKHVAEHERRMEVMRRVNEEQRSSRSTYHTSNKHR